MSVSDSNLVVADALHLLKFSDRTAVSVLSLKLSHFWWITRRCPFLKLRVVAPGLHP